MRFVFGIATLVILTAACGAKSDDGPEDNPETAPTLVGRWKVEGEPIYGFGTSGAMSLEFSSASAGKVRFLGVEADSAATTCGDYVFSLLDGRVLLFESTSLTRAAFLVEWSSKDSLKLTSDYGQFTLTRVTGDAPVAECGRVTREVVASFTGVRAESATSLTSFGNTLYFNTNAAGEPIVGYSLETKALGMPRVYSFYSGGGTDNLVAAAGSDNIFYGHCGCGADESVARFDVSTNTELARVSTATLGKQIGVDYGFVLGGDLFLGGRDRSSANTLLTLDATTLALKSSRTFLNNLSVSDVAQLDGKLYALAYPDLLLEVGEDGKAAKTYPIPGLRDVNTYGLESVNGKLYVLTYDHASGATQILQLTLN